MNIHQRPIKQGAILNQPDPALIQLEQVAACFDPITLAEIGSAALLDRVDTKYVVGISQLQAVLANSTEHYRIVSINHKRLNHYQTIYFDTADFALYQQHHNGLAERYKVRARKYIGSNLAYFEIKHKTNHNRTIKSRLQIPDVVTRLNTQVNQFVNANLPFDASHLEPKLWNEYLRLTLVSNHRPERVTIDLNLEFAWRQHHTTLPGLAVVEVKQQQLSQTSDFIQHMRHINARPISFSKYCMGVWMLYTDMKANNFKPQIRQVNRIMQEELAHESLH